ncbi:hypothetical protein SAMN06265182_0685 [Persephonella hydrogeniphila]|uniref:Uncharacterized protein n=1 Tax=Persephonella hydrogeniphila TaxID=198703 RepID=A0A285NAG8_9AQUI|nr:hypothetical protein [Persephonella hydrogeniphila]SNZ06465.1 hypothetical protein SAMN06265182_0685 [Persephonella hydrogeniphila]
MNKKIFYIFLFLFSFLSGLIYTFPADRVISYYLKKADIGYTDVEGDIFSIKITDFSIGKVYINSLSIKNLLLLIEFYIDKEKIASFSPLNRSVYLLFDRFDIDKAVKGIKGKITGENYLRLVEDNVYVKGKGDIYIENYPEYMLKDIHISYDIKEGKKNKIKAQIKSSIVQGDFSGELFLPVSIKKGYIKGFFKGEMLEKKVKQNIFFRF